MPDQTMSGTSAAGRWHASSSMLRRAGVGVTALHAVRHPELASWYDRADANRRQLTAIAESLADRLFARIGAVGVADDQQLRPALVGLRRAVHRHRRPAGSELTTAVLGSLDEPGRTLLTDYLRLLDQDHELSVELDRLLRRLDTIMIDSLRRELAAPVFRHGIAAASPSLAEDCERWLRRPDQRPQRKKIIRLAKYLARAATKTSPYSTFTSMSPAVWSRAPEPVTGDDHRARGVIELDGEFWDAVCAALLSRPEIADRVPIAVNASLPSDPQPDDRLLVIGPAPAEQVLEIACTPAIAGSLRTVSRYGHGGRRRVASELADSTGQSATQCGRFLDRLIQLGLVHPVIPVPDHDHHPWQRLARWLESYDPEGSQAAAKMLTELSDEIETVVVAGDLMNQVGRLTAISRTTEELAGELGIRNPAVPHETAVGPAVALRASRAWQSALDDVDVARRWLTLFDAGLPVRLTIADWYRRTAGDDRRLPFPEFYRRYRADLGPAGDPILRQLIMTADSPFPAGLDRCPAPAVRELAALRRRSIGMIDHEAAAVTLATERIGRALAEAPAWLQAPSSVGCYVQPISSPDGVELVINAMHLGHARADGRMNRLLERAGLPGLPVQRLPADVAEFGADFGSTMNHRDHRTRMIIDYPFGPPHCSDQRITPGDLTVGLDHLTGLLELQTRSGAVVRPAHLGMSAEFVLPPVARLLERTFASSLLVHPSAPPLSTADVTSTGGRPRYPRVNIGRAVVQRARWCIPGEQFPSRRPGDSDGRYLARLHTALADRGIGQRFFLRAWTGDRTAASKSRKPIYVDCASVALVTVMERAVVGAKLIVIDEALPDPLTSRDGCVEEIFVELTDGEPDGRHE